MINKRNKYYIKPAFTDANHTALKFNITNNTYVVIIGAIGSTSICAHMYLKKDAGETIVANFGKLDIPSISCDANGNVVITINKYYAGIMFCTEDIQLLAI